MSINVPVQLLRVCRSSPVTVLPSMKPRPTLNSSRLTPVLCRVLPFRFKCPGVNPFVTCRRFSTRPVRSRSGSSSGFNRYRERGEVRATKSLIEDEAELSDWVSELRTDTFRGRLTSDDEESELGRIRRKVKGKDKHRNGGKESSSTKRREGAPDEFDEPNRRRNRDSGRRGSRDQGKNARSISSDSKGSGLNLGSRRHREGEKDLRKRSRDSERRSSYTEDEESDGVVDLDAQMKSVMGGGLGDLLTEDGTAVNGDEVDDVFLRQKASSALGFAKDEKGRSSPEPSRSYLSESRFDQFPLSPLSLKAIEQAGYEKMTEVQEATLPAILKGKDILAKAKTGTGKTAAYLLPSIEVVASMPPADYGSELPPFLVLVISPTRELANQIAAEADKLLKYHPNIGAQVLIGGTRLAVQQKHMRAKPCQILVATPGRLRDHIENTGGFARRLKGVKVLVLDEADQMLKMGFRKDLTKIIRAVRMERQTLLFSATIPEEVQGICHVALRRDHEFINVVQEGDEETHPQVRQTYMIAPLDEHFSLLYVLLKEHVAENVDYKVIVFCTTAKFTRLVADLLGELKLNIREIHSRKSQSYRDRISDEFRKSKGLILVSSDVSARGVDYPDVTLVMQVGLPAGREQYIHRIGRTGRKGKEGQGILLLAPWENFFLSAIKDLPIKEARPPSVDPGAKKQVERALCHVEMKTKEVAYQSWLGYYNTDMTIGKNKYDLVKLANEFSRCLGMDNPPAIPKKILTKMGLKNVPGLRSK